MDLIRKKIERFSWQDILRRYGPCNVLGRKSWTDLHHHVVQVHAQRLFPLFPLIPFAAWTSISWIRSSKRMIFSF